MSRIRFIVIVALLLLPSWRDPRAGAAEPTWRELSLPRATEGEATLGSLWGKQATVLVFLSTECPMSNGYIPTLNRLAETFESEGVVVVGVNSNAGQSLKEISRHARDFSVGFPVLKDPGGVVARALGATTCPQVFLFDAQEQIAYRGRIDDRYVRRGGAARAVGRADLELAIKAVLSGEPVEVAMTRPLGCLIDQKRVDPASESVAVPLSSPAAPTYSREISRLLQRHCQECHRPGGIGPFALEDYGDAVRWSADIAAFTADRSMPPWKAAPGFGEFAHPRAMAQRDIDQIADWVKADCPEGDRSELPEPREFSSDWRLGRVPDAILEIPEYTLGADGPDEYRCFVLPTQFAEDRYVTAIEVRPGNARVVHHVIAFLDVTGRARKLDENFPGPGYITSAGFPGFLPSGGLGGWAPGNQPRELPQGMARLLPRGADVALQIHYHRSGRLETDRTQIGLYFAQTPVDRGVRNVPVLPLEGPLGDLRIPAGAARHEVRTALVLPQDMQAVAITPHMHLLGRDMTVIARLPDGTVQNLIRIENWDFNWQESYTFQEPVALPRKTRIELTAHFDNSTDNPHNPFRPPQDVAWGESTDEEMCIAFIEMAPARPDPASLRAPTRREQMRFFLESRWLDDTLSPADKARLLKRMSERIQTLERTGGVAP